MPALLNFSGWTSGTLYLFSGRSSEAGCLSTQCLDAGTERLLMAKDEAVTLANVEAVVITKGGDSFLLSAFGAYHRFSANLGKGLDKQDVWT
jgi:hypothetical protein